MAAVAANTEAEQSQGKDDSTADMSGISDDDDSAYLDEGEQDVADDSLYVNNEDPTHPPFALWTQEKFQQQNLDVIDSPSKMPLII
eukprot:6298011-Ditylum_brightwellii.AAC.1